MWNYIRSFIWPVEEPKDLEAELNSAYELLKAFTKEEEKPKEDDEQVLNFTYETKVGFITDKKTNYCIIDNLHKVLNDNTYSVGQKVSYMLLNENNKTKVSQVKILPDDDWVENINHKANWCLRTTIGEVSKREGRLIYVQPKNICVDLNQTASEFIPIVGDWVELEIKCELNENVPNLFGDILSVTRIRPLRTKIIQGKIRSFNNFNGCIDFDTYFDISTLSDGYSPRNGDVVFAEVMESTQKNLSWRALKVVLQNGNKYNINNCFKTELPKLIQFQRNIDGVTITDDVSLIFDRLGETKTFKIVIENNNDDMYLNSVKFDTQIRQVKLICNSVDKLVIKQNETLELEFLASLKSAGESCETVIFAFDNFNIGRNIHLTLKQRKYFDNYRKKNNSRNFYNSNDNSNEIIRGVKNYNCPRFVAGQLGLYSVPEDLKVVFLKYDCRSTYSTNKSEKHFDIIKIRPCLNDNLSYTTYEDRFHTLLYLEEIVLVFGMRNYDQDRACFIRNDQYLMLEIENLAEQRPSIIIGDCVLASDPINTDANQFYEGCVHKVSAKHLYLKFHHHFHEQYDGQDYKIVIRRSRTLNRKLHHGIKMGYKNLGPNILFPSRVIEKTLQVNFVYDKYVDDLSPCEKKVTKFSPKNTLKIMKRFSLEQNSKIEENLLNTESPLKLTWFNENLNYFQKEAVRNILLGKARPLPYIIFGPPGTGKTITVIEIILQVLRLIPHSRILVATPSNSAADLIATRLIDSKCLNPGDLVRFVSYRALVENIIPLNLKPYCTTGSISNNDIENMPTSFENDSIVGVSKSVLGMHRITVGTCNSFGTLHGMGFVKGHFTHIIVDEAGQCTEPQIMIPLSLLDLSEGQAILAGDPKQLGPVVISKEAEEYGLAESYMCRIIERFPYLRDAVGFPVTNGYDPRLITFLVYNYRSLPDIFYLSNKWFYNFELRPILSEKEGKEISFLNTFKEILPYETLNSKVPSLVFHGLTSMDCRGEDSPSWYNPDEASQIFFYINELYRLGAKSTDIGVISPYIKQVKQIREILKDADFDVPKIGTVEEFQGQERNVILMSTVRTNSELLQSDAQFNLGFISNPRRLNVMLTRAQCLIIIVGNPHLLMQDKYWNELILNCVKNNSYVGCKL